MKILKQMAGWGVLACLLVAPAVSQAQYCYSNTNASPASCTSTTGIGKVTCIFESTTAVYAGSAGVSGDGIFFDWSGGEVILQSPMNTSQVITASINMGSGGQTITVTPHYNYGTATFTATLPPAVNGKNIVVSFRWCRTAIFDSRIGVISQSQQTGSCFPTCTEGQTISVNSTCNVNLNGVSWTGWTSMTVCSNGSPLTITQSCPQCVAAQGVMADTYQIVNGVAKAVHYWYCSNGVWTEGFATGVSGLPTYVHYEGDGVSVYTPDGSGDGLLQVASHGNQINSAGNITPPNTSSNSLANPSLPQQQVSSNAVNIANMPALQAAVSGGASGTVAAVMQSDKDIVDAINNLAGDSTSTIPDFGTLSDISNATNGWGNPALALSNLSSGLPNIGSLTFGTVGVQSDIPIGNVEILGSTTFLHVDLSQHAGVIAAFRAAATMALGIWAWFQSVKIIRSAIA